MPLNLRVQIIERRKKSGSTQHYIDDFQDFLLSCFKISLVTLILEVGGVFRLRVFFVWLDKSNQALSNSNNTDTISALYPASAPY